MKDRGSCSAKFVHGVASVEDSCEASEPGSGGGTEEDKVGDGDESDEDEAVIDDGSVDDKDGEDRTGEDETAGDATTA